MKTTLLASACLALAGLAPATSQAAPAPAWSLAITPLPSNFSPSAPVDPEYLVGATNVGGAPTSGTATLTIDLPAGFTPTKVSGLNPGGGADPICMIIVQEVSCVNTAAIDPGFRIQAQVAVSVSAAPGIYETEAQISGGGTAQTISAVSPTPVQAGPVPFDILPGFIAPLTEEDGSATTEAGAHPYQQTASFSFPTREPGDEMTNVGYPRDIWFELPRGLGGNLGATPVLCTEVQLTVGTCPPPSQIGVVDVTTALGRGLNGVSSTPLYNMVPPPGAVASFATDVAEVGLYLHTLVGVRSDGDYGVEALSPDLLALGTNPVFGAQVQVWGDPSAAAHDAIRRCPETSGSCPVAPQEVALLTAPADCPGTPLIYEVLADSWEEPFPAFEKHSTTYEGAELTGDPVHFEDCGALDFEPTIKATPTTNLTDSPSGLDVAVHQTADVKLGSRSTAPLRDAVIRLPAGLAVNPAQAAGLGACTEQQIGFEEETPAGRLDFSKQPQSCPDAAKIGTIEVTSPALVARNTEHEVEEDPEDASQVLETLHGSLYIATPFENPFNSLIAVYLVVEDAQTGIVAKLAGRGELDPQTGQISTFVRESPEMPIEDFKVHLFGGPRGSFVTPPVCGTHTTEAQFTPWSSPEGADATPTASFATAATPLGGPCPTSEDQLPNTPNFVAGTESPAAGKYSPLIFSLSREDGTQRIVKVESTLPTGLLAKLAGVGQCSEADIAQAHSREEPEMGVLEQADPSCPASSQVGVVTASAGAGPNPYFTTGNAYLAGPYKGAPLSVVTIAPAVAGPFDLGAVVVRIALYLDPTTGQGRAVSDPVPLLLHGVPIDLRSVSLRSDRPEFTLNPTSCEEKSFQGQAISALGLAAPLFERFQVGGCESLPFKPKLDLRLFGPANRGAHPRLRAILTNKAGSANIAATTLTLPKSEFIDQAHFRTICTRVQYAANQCPAGSVYGHVKVLSPLLDYPLEGNIHLRSSTQELPDTVFALRGPPHQPIAIDAVGHVDSVKGRLRVRFPEIPDAPLSKAIVTMQGAKKGLFQNSTNICKGTHRAVLKMKGHNGKVFEARPVMKAQCKGKGGGKGKGKAKGGGGR